MPLMLLLVAVWGSVILKSVDIFDEMIIKHYHWWGKTVRCE